MTASEETSLPVDEVIRVIKGAPILIVQNHIAELISGQKVYVGNGTTGVFWEYDASLDAIFAKVNIASRKELFVRIKRRDFSTTTKTRSQFPFMLAWAATIHKVQGMEFDCIEVDFCLDTRNSGASDFYQGLAYMALSRAETVIVHGKLTVTLLNNINRQSLQWWNRQLSKWIDFKRTKSTPSRVFRNAIHVHNFYAAASQKQVHKIVTAPATVLLLDPENDANNWETYSEELFETEVDDLVHAPASFNPATLPSLRPAGAQASAPAIAPTLDHVPASAPAPAPLPAPAPSSHPDKAEAGAEARGFTHAAAPAPVLAPASVPAPACALTHLVDDLVPPPASDCALTSASAQPPAHNRPYRTTGRHTAFTSRFVNALASAPGSPSVCRTQTSSSSSEPTMPTFCISGSPHLCLYRWFCPCPPCKATGCRPDSCTLSKACIMYR